MIDYIAQNISFSTSLLFLVATLTVYVAVDKYRSKRQILALGGYSPNVKAWPLAIDFIIRGWRLAVQNRNLDFWLDFFRETEVDADGNGSYTCEVTLGTRGRLIFTADPDNTKAILTGQFADYGKGYELHRDFEPFLGDSIFTTDGEKWQFARTLLRPMFARDRVVNVAQFEHHLQKLMPMLGTGNGSEVEITQWFFRYTLDAAMDFLLGAGVGSMEDPDNAFAVHFDRIQAFQMNIIRAGPFQFLLNKRGYLKDIKWLNDFIDPIIDDVLQLSPEELDQKLSKKETFLHQLARATRDRTVIRDQISAILLAGRDTTACTLSWTLYELARHPEAQQKLRKEIIDHLGPSGKPPSYQDIKDMKYLTWVMNETLRRYPVVPYNVRYALKDTTLPRGGGPDGTRPIGIRKGTGIGYSPLLMQRRRDLYPPVSDAFPYDSDEWAPERWANWVPKSWQYIPFNGGPRICIGQQFALIEMGYTICRIFQHFDYIADLREKSQEVLKAQIVLIPAEGIRLGFHRQSQTTGP